MTFVLGDGIWEIFGEVAVGVRQLELFDELTVDERDERGEEVSMGDERCLIGV